MNRLLSFLTLISILAVSAMAQVETKWISQAVVPGEKTILLVIMTNGTMVEPMPLAKAEGVSIRFSGSNYLRWEGAPNRTAYYVAFEVTADKPGSVTIPSITLRADHGGTYRTQPQTLIVYPFSAIKWQDIPQNDGRYQYGTLWHVADQTPYVNQPDPCELKFYTPDLISDYQLPVIKTNGLAAWRFEPALLDRNVRPLGSALIRGREWKVMTFHSAVTPIRGGATTVSGEVTAYTIQENTDPMLAQFVRNRLPVNLPIPSLEITAKTLPPGAPASFSNAVGQFTIKTTTQALDLSANEPVSVQVTVEGTGNIDSLNCPEVQNSSLWKLYPANKLSSNETRSLSGKVIFQRLMRPTAETDSIPPFELTYFDPSLQSYKTVTSSPIPLPWKASAPGMVPAGTVAHATPPPAGITPVEKMTDIYGNIPQEVIASLRQPVSSWWYLLAYIPGILIFAAAINSYFKKKREISAENRARLAAFKAIPTKSGTNSFLRSLGSFIEANIPESSRDDVTRDILRTRDAQAFLPESSGSELSSAQRSNMLKHIRQILAKLPVLLFCFLVIGLAGQIQAQEPAITAQQAYSKGEFTLASEKFAKEASLPALSPEQRAAAYFGLGNSLYKLNKPGEAALNYRKALLLIPSFTEASKNLSFIERKEGALMPPTGRSYEWLTYIPYHQLIPIILVSGAVLLAAVALLTACRKWTVFISIIATLAFLSLIAAGANRIMYPQTPASISPSSLLITTQSTPARPAADPDSPALLTLPPSTPLIEIAKRGSWYYVHTFGGTPAWVHQETVSPVSSEQ